MDLTPNNNNNTILNLSSLLHTIIKVEKPYKIKRGPPQCHNCQEYGHTANYCGHASRCVKCGEEHHSNSCTKDKSSPAKCILCKGTHTANFKGCPIYKSLINHKKKSNNRMSHHREPKEKAVPNPVFPLLSAKTSCLTTNSNNSNITNTNNISNIETLLSKFLSDLTSLINPLLSLLSAIIQKKLIP